LTPAQCQCLPQNNITYPGGLHVSTPDVFILEVDFRPAYILYPGLLFYVPLQKESWVARLSQVNCNQNLNAGRTNRDAHDRVQLALKKEFQRLDLRVVYNDNEMRKQYAHLCSQKRGYLAILSAPNFLIYSVSCHQRSRAIADTKMVSLVNSQGTWVPATSRNKNKIENPGLIQQEQFKNLKRTDFYAPIGFAFFALVASCFGSFGPSAVRCLFSVADLETRQHEPLLACQGFPPTDPSTRSHFRAICLTQSRCCQGFGHALLGVPSLSLPTASSFFFSCSEVTSDLPLLGGFVLSSHPSGSHLHFLLGITPPSSLVPSP
jgi:hypothetical protein